MHVGLGVISLCAILSFSASATTMNGVAANRVSCADYLSSMLEKNQFLIDSVVVPILPYDSMFRSAKSKFKNVLPFLDLWANARSEKPRQVRLMVHFSGLSREQGDGQKIIKEIADYGVTPEFSQSANPSTSDFIPEFFLILNGPTNLVLDVVGHPAVTIVTRIIEFNEK